VWHIVNQGAITMANIRHVYKCNKCGYEFALALGEGQALPTTCFNCGNEGCIEKTFKNFDVNTMQQKIIDRRNETSRERVERNIKEQRELLEREKANRKTV